MSICSSCNDLYGRKKAHQRTRIESHKPSIEPRPLWRAQKTFIEKWGRPYIIEHHQNGWLLSTINTLDYSSYLLLLDENFKIRELLYSAKSFMRFCFEKEKQAVYFLESDINAFQQKAVKSSCASRLSMLNIGTKAVSILAEGDGNSFFAMDLALLHDDKLLVSDLAKKQLVLLSSTGERQGQFDIGERLVVKLSPDFDGIYMATHSSINRFFRTSDSYDSIYRMSWDGNLQRIHSTGLPGEPGHIYGLKLLGNKLIYSSYHSITMIDKRGEILWELPMTAQVWKKERQSYCVGIFPDSNSPETMQAISWGDKHDVIWNITTDTKEKHHAESGST